MSPTKTAEPFGKWTCRPKELRIRQGFRSYMWSGNFEWAQGSMY